MQREENSLSVVFQHGGAFHDVLLVNWSNVNSRVLLREDAYRTSKTLFNYERGFHLLTDKNYAISSYSKTQHWNRQALDPL